DGRVDDHRRRRTTPAGVRGRVLHRGLGGPSNRLPGFDRRARAGLLNGRSTRGRPQLEWGQSAPPLGGRLCAVGSLPANIIPAPREWVCWSVVGRSEASRYCTSQVVRGSSETLTPEPCTVK